MASKIDVSSMTHDDLKELRAEIDLRLEDLKAERRGSAIIDKLKTCDYVLSRHKLDVPVVVRVEVSALTDLISWDHEKHSDARVTGWSECQSGWMYYLKARPAILALSLPKSDDPSVTTDCHNWAREDPYGPMRSRSIVPIYIYFKPEDGLLNLAGKMKDTEFDVVSSFMGSIYHFKTEADGNIYFRYPEGWKKTTVDAWAGSFVIPNHVRPPVPCDEDDAGDRLAPTAEKEEETDDEEQQPPTKKHKA
jgi:hypothetical protein